MAGNGAGMAYALPVLKNKKDRAHREKPAMLSGQRSAEAAHWSTARIVVSR